MTQPAPQRSHPRTIGWIGTAALGMGGSNQSIFLIGALIAGQGSIPGQGSAAIPLLMLGLLLSYAAAPGWIELVLMSPDRVGGIAAACTAAFRPYSPILSALTGVCYWWGWVPTCGLTAIFSATAICQWVLPSVPVWLLASLLVTLFSVINLCGIKWVTRTAVPIATASATLAFISMLAPVLGGTVDWHKATDFRLTTPFPGWFGALTSTMAGLYLIGFGAPAFEAATCHVAETIDQNRNVPRAVLANAAMAAVYFAALPLIWLGVIGADGLAQDLNQSLGPTFAPVLGSAAKSAAIWFMMFNMFHGTIQPLAGAARTLSQLADDGLLPTVLGKRMRGTDAPWVATVFTAGFSILFLLIGDPIWLVAAANFTYLIGICLPSIAVWLLRRDAPDMPRPWRAPRGTIGLGVAAACIWGISALLGFEQFGLPTVVIGLLFAYSGAFFFALRHIEDRMREGKSPFAPSLHVTLTGAMLLVLALDAVGYIIAVSSLPQSNEALITALEDIFVAVAILTVTVGIVLPGMIAHSAGQISDAARRLASGTLRDFSTAMERLGVGDLEAARAKVDIQPVVVSTRDEIGAMADSFNIMQAEIKHAAAGLDGAREGLKSARAALVEARDAAEAGNRSKSEFLSVISHELRTPLNGVIGMAGLLAESNLDPRSRHYAETLREAGDHLLNLINDVLDFTKLDAGHIALERAKFDVEALVKSALDLLAPRAHGKGVEIAGFVGHDIPQTVIGDSGRLRQILINLIGNAVKFTDAGAVSVEVYRLPAEAPAIMLGFEIRDTGIGISADRLPHLFAEFVQADSSTSRRYGGTGLGLAISRKLIEGMGGSITAQSESGRGSLFRFSIALQLADEPQASARPRFAPGSRVLVVDDTEITRTLAARHITALGGQATTAATQSEALGHLRRAASAGQPVHAVLIDQTIAGGDGVSLAKEVRADASLPPTRLVLAASSTMPPSLREAAAGLFESILIKPLLGLDLAGALRPAELASHSGTQAPDAAPQSASTARQLRLLVAEDNSTNQVVIRAMLERLGHEIHLAANGAAAVEAAAHEDFDAILMDIMMPEMDGVEATRRIRALPGPRGRLPILALTAHVAAEDHEAYLQTGIDDVISKPVTLDTLRKTLQRLSARLAASPQA